MGGPVTGMARLLPGPRPDAALPLHEDGPPDTAMAPARGALGTQIAPTPRAAGSVADGLSRCHRGRPPPRPGVGGAVGRHHDQLRGPDELPLSRSRLLPLLL